MSRKHQVVLFAGVALSIAGSILSGCKTPCTYPDQNAVKVRIFNAMPDENFISIFVNGRLLVKDYPYDEPTNFIHDGTSTSFSYLSTYDDGTPLVAGSSLPIVITSDAAGKDTILKTSITLNFHLQTLIVMGKGNSLLPADIPLKKILRIEDDIQPSIDTISFMRFVHTVPDLPAMDVYWNQPDGSPNATILYGVENPYINLTNANFLKITEKGNPSNVIFASPYKPAPIPGLVLTTIVRGESKPFGNDRTVSTFILSDGNSTFGGLIVDFVTFGVRFVNASRSLNLNLLILGNQDSLPRLDYPNQKIVENIGADSVTGYLPLMPKFDSIAKYWFSADLNFPKVDTFIIPGFHAPFPFRQDHRFSIIAVENKKLGETGRSLDTLILEDSMTSQPNMGRVRVIHLSPDHNQISFILGGKLKTMYKKQVEFFDVTPGLTTITLDDGTIKKDVTITVPLHTPISLYLMPATISDSYPFKISED